MNRRDRYESVGTWMNLRKPNRKWDEQTPGPPRGGIPKIKYENGGEYMPNVPVPVTRNHVRLKSVSFGG